MGRYRRLVSPQVGLHTGDPDSPEECPVYGEVISHGSTSGLSQILRGSVSISDSPTKLSERTAKVEIGELLTETIPPLQDDYVEETVAPEQEKSEGMDAFY